MYGVGEKCRLTLYWEDLLFGLFYFFLLYPVLYAMKAVFSSENYVFLINFRIYCDKTFVEMCTNVGTRQILNVWLVRGFSTKWVRLSVYRVTKNKT